MAAAAAPGAVRGGGDRRAGPAGDDRQLPRLGLGVLPPRLLLGLLIYGYATGVFSSRKLERATYDSVAFRFIAANEHPDHDTIATFRRRFLQADRGAVRAGAAAGPRDGRAEDGHGGAGRHQDPRQRQPAQRAVV